MRKEDERLENVVSEYLDNNLYYGMKNFERINDKHLQIQGVDVIIGDSMLIDEKMATSYINKDLKTFTLELGFLNRSGKKNEGWFIKDNFTTHYALGYLKATKDKYIEYEDINEIEVILVSKQKLLDFINSKISLTNIFDIYEDVLNGKNIREINNILNLDLDRDGFVIIYSPRLIEKPLNIMMKKEIYKQLSDEHYFI